MNILRNIYLIATDDFTVIGIGETKFSFEKRHKDGDWAKFHNFAKAKGLKVILVGWWENVDISDRDIHKWYKLEPNICKYSEWFAHKDRIPLDVQYLKYKIEKKFFSTTPEKKETLNLRPHQKKFVEKILSSWEQWTEFLLFAKCRGGKSIMTLSTIVEADVKRTLIVSRFNSPKQSWFDDCNKFGKFKNIRVVKLNEDKWVNEYKRWADDPDIHIIFWSTVQGLCASKNSRLNKLKRLTSIELIVFDECHIGDDADQFKKVRDKFRDAKCLKVSGTAYDQVWDYPEHRFVYSYWDEQYYYPDKHPRMNVYTPKFNVTGYREIFGNDPDAFTNIFLVNEDKTAFLYPDLVRNFWNKYFTVLGQRHLRTNERIIINRNHIIASLPSIEACRLSVPLISDYAALDVTSKTKEDSDSINKFVKEHSKTICLTVEANVLGVTCEEWDCVVHLWKGSDKKRWVQLTFRGGSGKHDWDVVDFAPKRAVGSLFETLTVAKAGNPELDGYKVTDFVNIFEWDENFKQLSQDRLIDLLDVKGDVQGSFKNLSRSISDERLNQEDFNTVDLASDKKPQSSIVNDNDTNDKSAKKLVDGFGEKKPTEKEKNRNRKKLEQILNSIPLVLAHASKSGKPIRTPDELFSSEFYEPITQDIESVVYNLLKTRDMSARDITTIIHQNNPIIDKSVRNDFTKTLDSFRITKQTQQVIPLDLLRKLLPKVEEDNYVFIVGDPSGSCCSYVIEHLGVSPSNVWVWEDHPTHKFLIQSISSEINILNNIEDYTMNKSKTYCIGNPPYSSEDRNDNQKVWKKHLFNAMSRAKTTSFVVPASVISPSIHFNEIRPHLSYILTDVKKYFPNTASTFVVITVEDSIQDQCLIETKDCTFEISLKDIQFLPNNITRENIEYLQKTLKGGREWKSNSVYPSSINFRHQWENPEGKIEVLHTNNKSFFTDKESSLNKEIRVAVTKSGEPNFQVVHNKGLTECMIYTDGFDTLDEAQKYCAFCNSNVIQKALSLSKFSGWTTRTVINNIPNILNEE
tara:strand:+ start:1614 stop:4697 length:3084 start_codon:yes stop_codon:yes gene_type:complete